MQTVLKLDKRDITAIIADKFGCNANKVRIEAKRTYAGYGPMETDTYSITGEVILDNKEETGGMPKCLILSSSWDA